MRAQRPLNPQAVQAANQKLWEHHEEELQGRQLTMAPGEPETSYRKEWMEAYNAALAEQNVPPPTSGDGEVGDPSSPCPGETLADLVVTVTRRGDGSPIEGADVQIEGPVLRNVFRIGTTDASGDATFSGICPGFYTVFGAKTDYTSDTTDALVSPATTSPAALVLSELTGWTCERCKQAQEKDPKIKKTIEDLEGKRKWASRVRYTMSLAALDHFLDGTGTWKEIPQNIVENTRVRGWADHKKKAEEVFETGAKSKLARELMKTPSKQPFFDSPKPVDDWPGIVEVEMEWISGPKTYIKTDENLAYNGATIRSQVIIECFRSSAERMAYDCRIRAWRAYVYDNYDWDYAQDDKQAFLGWPSQSEMDDLTKVGCAKSYQRSSSLWNPAQETRRWSFSDAPEAIDGEPEWDPQRWSVRFSSEADVRASAQARWEQDDDRRNLQNTEENTGVGALPIPGPAEEMKGGKPVWPPPK